MTSENFVFLYLCLLLYCILYVTSTTIALKFNPIHNSLTYISDKDNGDMYI